MNILQEIESSVATEFEKLKAKLEALKLIKELESEIEKLKAKLEGSTDAASALDTASKNVTAVIHSAAPTLEVPVQSGNETVSG